MLYFIAVWILLLVLCCIIGTGVLSILRIQNFERLGDRWIVSEWLGIVILSVGLLGISIFLPVNSIVGAIFAVSLCAIFCVNQRTRNDLITFGCSLTKQKLFSGIALLIIIAALTSEEVNWNDTGLYHYGLIQWLHQFGTVRGLALLFENLGFTSSWFAFAAPLNPEILEARVSAVTNGFAYLLAVLHGSICFSHFIEGRARINDWFMAAFSLVFLSITYFFPASQIILISPSPDILVGLMVGVTAWSILAVCSIPLEFSAFKFPTPESSTYEFSNSPLPHQTLQYQEQGAIVPLILAAGTVSFKLIGLPLLLVVGLYYLVQTRLRPSKLLLAVGVVSLILAPFFAVNLLTSGCLLYPSTSVCFDLPWALDPEVIQNVASDTHRWTSWYGTPPPGVPVVLWASWRWFNESFTNKATVALILISILLSIFILKLTIAYRYYNPVWLVIIAMTSIAFFMFTAPFHRFTMPYLFMIPSLAIGLYLMKRSQHHKSWFLQSILTHDLKKHPLFFSLAPLFLAALLTIGSVRNDYFRLLLPPQLLRVPYEQTQVNNVPYRLPLDEELCWATEIPCAYGVLNDMTFRNPDQGYRAGFVRRVP
jgi:hypothetical protein